MQSALKPVADDLPALPDWADCLEGRLALSIIIAERPIEYRSRRRALNGYQSGDLRHEGKAASKLRYLYKCALRTVDCQCVAEHYRGVPWDEASKPLYAFYELEDADALIRRVLDETAPRFTDPVAVKSSWGLDGSAVAL